jgi:hypothetical protein
MQKTHDLAMLNHLTHNSNAALQHYHPARMYPSPTLSKPDIAPD